MLRRFSHFCRTDVPEKIVGTLSSDVVEDAISLIKERVKQKAKMQKDSERKKILQLLEKAEMQKDEDRNKINELWKKIMID